MAKVKEKVAAVRLKPTDLDRIAKLEKRWELKLSGVVRRALRIAVVAEGFER